MLEKLSKNELAEIVLREIRSREGCEGVSTVVIQKGAPSSSDWQIAIVVAGKGDPVAVQKAASEVQKSLQKLYGLELDNSVQ